MPLDPYLTSTIPAYGEYLNLTYTIKTNRETGVCLRKNFEIIAVDDGSADDSSLLLERFNNDIGE